MRRTARAWRLHDAPLRRRFAASVVVAGVVLAALTTLTAVSLVRVNDAQVRVTDSYFSAARSSSSLLSAYLDQETGVRGYLITRDPRFREPYTRGRAEELATVGDLNRALAGEPSLRRQLDTVTQEAQQWRSRYAEPTITQVANTAAAQVIPDQQNEGKQYFDRLRVAVARFDAAVLADRNAAVEDLNRGRVLATVTFGVLAGFVVLALLGLGAALRRWIIDPLDRLRLDIRQVAHGDVEHEINASGPPDLRQVGGDVERMRQALLASYTQQLAATRTVERQREQLQQQTDDLRRSNAELEQFAYVASHDLQEPLRKVASFTELLQRRYAGQLDERADSYIAYAVDGAHRMQRLINDLLAFSRVGRVGVVLSEVGLAEVLVRAQQNLAVQIEESDAEIEIGGEPLPTVSGDAGLLTQVFQNLLGNAIKFRRPGVRPQVRLLCRRDGDTWQLDIADNGIGIDPEYADRVFVIFSRLNRREDYPGTGIGLALCKKIVEYHGGRIWLASTSETTTGTGSGTGSGGGATLSLTLPVITAAITEPSATALPAAGVGAGQGRAGEPSGTGEPQEATQ